MPDHVIISLRTSDAELLAQVPHLFLAMHEEMAQHGMRLRLVDDGAERWLESLRPGLERFHRLCVAVADDRVVGFGHALVKLGPDYLGGARIGQIAHVFVLPEYRRSGIARALVDNLRNWLVERQVTSTELQVVHGNGGALLFWRSLGFEVELVQMRDH